METDCLTVWEIVRLKGSVKCVFAKQNRSIAGALIAAGIYCPDVAQDFTLKTRMRQDA